MSTRKTVKLKGDYVDSHERQEQARNAGCRLVVEFHFNSNGSTAVGGETWYKPGDESSREVATAIRDAYGSIGLPLHGDGPQAAVQGTRASWIRHYDQAAVLLEPLYVSNPTQAAWIHDTANLGRLAGLVADAIVNATEETDVIGLSVGHRYKTSSPHDEGAPCRGGDNEADHNEALYEKVAELLGSGTGPGPIPDAGPLLSPLFAGNAQLQEAALSLRPPYARSAESEEVGLIQDGLDSVMPTGDRIRAGQNRGKYGPRTEAVVRKFQAAVSLGVDGKVGRNTLRALDAAIIAGGIDEREKQPDPEKGLKRIIQIAGDSAIARYHWNDRGRAPLGYIKGMALVFGRVYCQLKDGTAAALEMARADRDLQGTDALTHYRSVFAAAGMDNSEDGAETLRHLFVLMLGLGMRESSGAHCEGRDTANSTSNTANSAEAGLFQTSWNARSASPLLPQLFNEYLPKPDSGFVEVFHEQVQCSQADWHTIGSGTGADFQELSKKCPAFAAEFAGVALRNLRRHWGPINTRAAEVRPEADEMFAAVQAEIDAKDLSALLL